jgi:hypothetical protein
MRAGFGDKAPQMQQQSRFLGDISKDSIEEWNLKPFHPYA